jgi:hypothetical protein
MSATGWLPSESFPGDEGEGSCLFLLPQQHVIYQYSIMKQEQYDKEKSWSA